nr:TetR/AcrR family transcriptional regulator [Thaumasiovibrio subtropicus]
MNKRQLTRQKILESAWYLFAEQGYEKTTTRQIAKEAKVADGTVFSHFPTKLEILRAGMTEKLAALDSAVTMEPEGDLLALGLQMATRYYRYYFENLDLSRALLKEVIWDMAYYEGFNQALFARYDESDAIQPIIPLIIDAYFMTLVFHLSKDTPSLDEALNDLEHKYRLLLNAM